MEFLDGGCVGYINAILTSRETTVAGYPTVVSELTFGKEQTGPPFTYEYVVTLTPETDCERDGRYIYAFTQRDFAGDYEANTAVLDRFQIGSRSLTASIGSVVSSAEPPPLTGGSKAITSSSFCAVSHAAYTPLRAARVYGRCGASASCSCTRASRRP